VEQVEQLARPIIEQEGLELVDVEYKKEGATWFLRIFIDKEEGAVDLDHCARVSEQLSDELDRVDPIPNAYVLDVSSIGAERPLKNEADFQKAIGEHVLVAIYAPISGRKEFIGKLLETDEENVTVQMDNEMIKIPKKQIAKARLTVLF
jgi:ribosome maturation factor RimP